MVSFSDASFRNLSDQVSSGQGHIVFLTGRQGKSAPLGLAANKVRWVVVSTLAAEALSFQSAIDYAPYLGAILSRVLGRKTAIQFLFW